MIGKYLLIHEGGELQIVNELPVDIDDSLEAGIIDVIRYSEHSGYQARAAGGSWHEFGRANWSDQQ